MSKRNLPKPKVGDLQVWWVPQIPMKSFTVPVKDVDQAIFLLDVLGKYDLFQYENHVKPDYSNVGGLSIYEADSDGEGGPGWVDWYNDDGDSIDDVIRFKGEGIDD